MFLIGLSSGFAAISLSAPSLAADGPVPRRTGPYLFPLSPNKAGDEVIVVQWCDRAADMQAVVDRHAAAGQAAANELYLKLVESRLCHFVPAPMPTTGHLVEQVGFANVMIALPMIGADERAVVEVWSATVEGIEGRAVFITLAHWAADETDEVLLDRPIAFGCLRAR